MKTLSITLEDGLYKQLKSISQARQISSFVAEAIKGVLRDSLQHSHAPNSLQMCLPSDAFCRSQL